MYIEDKIIEGTSESKVWMESRLSNVSPETISISFPYEHPYRRQSRNSIPRFIKRPLSRGNSFIEGIEEESNPPLWKLNNDKT